MATWAALYVKRPGNSGRFVGQVLDIREQGHNFGASGEGLLHPFKGCELAIADIEAPVYQWADARLGRAKVDDVENPNELVAA